MSDEKTDENSNFVTHSSIDQKELKIFMDNVGSKVLKEVIEEYNREPLDSEKKITEKEGHTAHELLVDCLKNLPTAKEMVESQKMTTDDTGFTINYPNAEEKEEQNDIMNKILLVRTAIREKHPQGKEFIQDTIPCPICKDGTVAFIISDHYNGHIHAGCSNGCVSWME